MAARYIGKRNQKMRIIFDDAIREDFTEDSPDIAFYFERTVGWRNKDWMIKTLATNVRCYDGYWSLFSEMERAGQISESADFVEYHFSQPGEASEDYGLRKISIVPAGRKQIWCEYPTRCGFPLGGTFLNIDLAYAPGEEPLTGGDLVTELKRTLRTLAEDESFSKVCVTYLRATQREAVDEDDMGAHVYSQNLTEELAEEWGYPRDEWYEHPVRYLY